MKRERGGEEKRGEIEGTYRVLEVGIRYSSPVIQQFNLLGEYIL